jgi:cation:H+ antiporter
MLTPILLILAGLVLLYLGGEFLVKGAGSLALRLGLTPLVAGLTVVAFGTSTPELVASIKAVLAGQGDIAVGNVIGSNTFNVAFILGITAMVCPLKAGTQAIRFDAPVMAVIAFVPLWILHDRTVSKSEGAILIVMIIAYVAMVVRMAKRTPETAEVIAEYDESMPRVSKNVVLDIAFIVAGLALLVFGSNWLIDGSVQIAKAFGVSEAIIGLTIVAAGTSTPELAASLVAAYRKQPDIALGNIIGSNIFNILAILGVTGFMHPIYAPGISMLDVAVMITFSVTLIPMIRSGGTLDRGEGFCLVLGYGVYLYWLWPK